MSSFQIIVVFFCRFGWLFAELVSFILFIFVGCFFLWVVFFDNSLAFNGWDTGTYFKEKLFIDIPDLIFFELFEIMCKLGKLLGTVFDDILNCRFILQRVTDFYSFGFLFRFVLLAFCFWSMRLVDFFDSIITQRIHFLLHIGSFTYYYRSDLLHRWRNWFLILTLLDSHLSWIYLSWLRCFGLNTVCFFCLNNSRLWSNRLNILHILNILVMSLFLGWFSWLWLLRGVFWVWLLWLLFSGCGFA